LLVGAELDHVAVDSSGNFYVTGTTASSGWTSGGFDPAYNGGSSDAFVARIGDPDTIPPTINGFSVSPASVELGGTFTISYTVSDSGGSGLNRVELWRTNNLGSWPAPAVATKSVTGAEDEPVSGSFQNAPPAAGDWWYGLHVYDTAGNLTTQTTPIHVVVNPADTTPPSPNPSGVEYYFRETTGHAGATDSGWQGSNAYEDTGLSPGTVYTYEVRTRDKSANHNEGAYSASASAAAASPVYRFWKPSDNTHFFTMSESEKDKLVNEYFDVFTFEKAAWYAYAV
jgi:hypothetical protein